MKPIRMLGKAVFGSRQPARSFRGGRKLRFFSDGRFLTSFGRLHTVYVYMYMYMYVCMYV